jgi:hypothetical protein
VFSSNYLRIVKRNGEERKPRRSILNTLGCHGCSLRYPEHSLRNIEDIENVGSKQVL